jgi:beta-glucosidase
MWAKGAPAFQVAYDEGLKVGYKWYDAEKKPVLFPFGYGLSYTTFSYSDVKASAGETVKVSFKLKNTGDREGAEIGEVYATIPDPIEPPKRLIGWSKVKLSVGEEKTVTVEVPRKYLSIWDEAKNSWTLLPGDYTIMVGGSSNKLPLTTKISLK